LQRFLAEPSSTGQLTDNCYPLLPVLGSGFVQTLEQSHQIVSAAGG
jgi:hypothetical protein